MHRLPSPSGSPHDRDGATQVGVVETLREVLVQAGYCTDEAKAWVDALADFIDRQHLVTPATLVDRVDAWAGHCAAPDARLWIPILGPYGEGSLRHWVAAGWTATQAGALMAMYPDRNDPFRMPPLPPATTPEAWRDSRIAPHRALTYARFGVSLSTARNIESKRGRSGTQTVSAEPEDQA